MIATNHHRKPIWRLCALWLCALMALTGEAVAQNSTYTLQGRVMDEQTQTPLPGASIRVNDTPLGCIADADGRFVLNRVPDDKRRITISFIGMRTQEAEATDRPVVVWMKPDLTQLGEVTVQVAYGTAKRQALVGSVGTLERERMAHRTASNLSTLLEGNVTGVQTSSTAQPGEEAALLIRGFSSVNGSNTPLYVVDGMPFTGSLSDLSLTDIESVSLLKDAASAALYGNRAANGVVLITTRQSRSTTLNLQATLKQGLSTRSISDYKRLGTDDFMEAMWQSARNSLLSGGTASFVAEANTMTNSSLMSILGYNIYNVDDNALFDENGKLAAGASVREGYRGDLDWYDAVKRTGYRQEYGISGEGGSDNGNYYLSLGYLDEESYVNYMGYDRLTARAAVNLSPRRWLKVGMSLNGSYQNYQGGTVNGSYGTNAFYTARMMAPIYPVHLHDSDTGEFILDNNGNRQYDTGTNRPQMAGRNMVWENELNSDRTRRTTLDGQAYLEIRPLRDVTFALKGNIGLSDSEARTYMNATVGDAVDVGRAYRYNYRVKNYQLAQELKWGHQWGDHYADLLLAHESYSYERRYMAGNKNNETFAGMDEWSNFTDIGMLTDFTDTYRTESYLGRARYNYAEKYYAEASARFDGSSRFHADHRWGGFWSVGGAWILSKEEFLKGVEPLDYLKLRASYGEVGNDAGVGLYGYMGLYNLDQNGGQVAVYKSQNEARDIRWETTASFGVAVEATLFGRWNLSAEYFDKRSKDLLFDVSLPLSAGANTTSNLGAMSVITQNIGTMSNRGWEFQTDVDLYRDRDWRWNVGANMTILRNKVIKLPEANREEGILSSNWRFMEGHSMYEWWLTQFVGVDQMTGNALYEIDYDDYYVGEPVEGKTEMPADYLVQIGEEYYTTNAGIARKGWSGSALPRFYGGFSTSLRWKSLSLSALFSYSVGGKMYDASYASLMSTGTTPHALHTDVLKSWREIPEGMTEDSPARIDPNGVPVLDSNQSIYNNAASNRFLVDASYLKLQNLTLSYSLPDAWMRTLDLQSVRLDLSVENAFYLTKRKGLNPQESFNGSTDNRFVSPRIFSLGVTVKL